MILDIIVGLILLCIVGVGISVAYQHHQDKKRWAWEDSVSNKSTEGKNK